MKDLKDIHIEAHKDRFFVPAVSFSVATGVCSIGGESFLENSGEFYDELGEWIDAYFDSGRNQLELNFKLIYFSTSSSKAILDMLVHVRKHKKPGNQFDVNWYYAKNDEDILQEGKDMEQDTGVAMNFVETEEV